MRRFLSPSHVFFFISFMHLERKVFRALPWRPFSSACFEHSTDSALRDFSVAFAFGADLVAAGGARVNTG